MPKRPSRRPQQQTPLSSWTIYKLAAKRVWLGEVEATDESSAIEKAAAEFKVAAAKLIAVWRRAIA